MGSMQLFEYILFIGIAMRWWCLVSISLGTPEPGRRKEPAVAPILSARVVHDGIQRRASPTPPTVPGRGSAPGTLPPPCWICGAVPGLEPCDWDIHGWILVEPIIQPTPCRICGAAGSTPCDAGLHG